MKSVASAAVTDDSGIENEKSRVSVVGEVKRDPGGTFKCSYCPLEEHYDYKGTKPPFARQIYFSEDCYVMKDPMSLPNRGEVLVLGSDCDMCKKPVCLGCSVFYTKRFCSRCANDCISNLPSQLHGKIKNLVKNE